MSDNLPHDDARWEDYFAALADPNANVGVGEKQAALNMLKARVSACTLCPHNIINPCSLKHGKIGSTFWLTLLPARRFATIWIATRSDLLDFFLLLPSGWVICLSSAN